MIVTAAISGCTTTAGPGSASGMTALYCAAYEPVRWSQADTDETIRQIKSNNAAHEALCS